MLDKQWRWDLNPGQTPEPTPPGELEASPQDKLLPSLLVQVHVYAPAGAAPLQAGRSRQGLAGAWLPLLAGSGHSGTGGRLQITASLPGGRCLFGHPRAIIYNPTEVPRVSSFRWPRKAKLIFPGHCSGNATPLSSTASTLNSRPLTPARGALPTAPASFPASPRAL